MAAVPPRRTKIVATIGPASSSPDVLNALIDSGIDAARLNLSHGTHADHATLAGLVRDAQEVAGRPLAIIGDLQGPKIRVGKLAAPIHLQRGSEVTVICEDGAVTRDGELSIAPAVVAEVLQPG